MGNFDWIRRGRQMSVPAPAGTIDPGPNLDSFAPHSTYGEALGGLVVSASSAGGKYVQQDAVTHLDLPGLKLAVVADGISSTSSPQLAAQTAAQTAQSVCLTQYQRGALITEKTIRTAFAAAHAGVRWQTTARGLEANPPGTTLLVAAELPDRFLIAYVGDGAIVYCRSGLEWLTNLLHPQTGHAGALTHYVGVPQSTLEPALIQIPKIQGQSDIVVLGSDGALALGSVLGTAEALLVEARLAVEAGRPADVQLILEEWVCHRLDSDDNRSLAVLVSDAALRAWSAPRRDAPRAPDEVSLAAHSADSELRQLNPRAH